MSSRWLIYYSNSTQDIMHLVYFQFRTPSCNFNRKLMSSNVAMGSFQLGNLENSCLKPLKPI